MRTDNTILQFITPLIDLVMLPVVRKINTLKKKMAGVPNGSPVYRHTVSGAASSYTPSMAAGALHDVIVDVATVSINVPDMTDEIPTGQMTLYVTCARVGGTTITAGAGVVVESGYEAFPLSLGGGNVAKIVLTMLPGNTYMGGIVVSS